MDFKLLLKSIVFLSLVVVATGCGKSDGYANSQSVNSYNFLYVGNFGSSTVNAFYIDSEGVVVSAAPMITTGVGTSSVSDLESSPDGKFLYSVNKNTNNVSWFSVDSMEAAAPGTITYSNQELANSGASAMKIHPSGRVAFVANASSLTDNISIFTRNSDTGVLTRSDTMATARTNPTNLAFSPLGNILFVVNRGTSDVSSFSVNSASGALAAINLSMSTGTNPEDLVIHPSGGFLYTLCVGVNSVYQHRISGGTISALSTPSIATGAGPKKMVMTPNGKYLLVTNNTANTISVFSVDSSTGLLTSVAGSPFAAVSGAGVFAITVTPESKYVIVSGDSNGKAYVYALEDSTGALTQVGGEITVGSNPRSLKIVPLTTIE